MPDDAAFHRAVRHGELFDAGSVIGGEEALFPSERDHAEEAPEGRSEPGDPGHREHHRIAGGGEVVGLGPYPGFGHGTSPVLLYVAPAVPDRQPSPVDVDAAV